MIEAMRTLLQRHGYSGTGLNDVVRASGAPKGSLYYYFPDGKEQLAIEAIRAAGEEMYGRLVAALGPEMPPDQALMAAARVLSEDLVSTDFAVGCPVATVALEMSATSEGLREACAEVYRRWRELLAAGLLAAGVSEEFAAIGASFALSTIEGAMLLARVERSTAPLDSAAALLANLAALLRAGLLPEPTGDAPT